MAIVTVEFASTIFKVPSAALKEATDLPSFKVSPPTKKSPLLVRVTFLPVQLPVATVTLPLVVSAALISK